MTWIRSADGSETVRAMTEREEIDRLKGEIKQLRIIADGASDEIERLKEALEEIRALAGS